MADGSLLKVCQRVFKGLREHEEKASVVWWDKTFILWAELQAQCLANTRHYSSPGSCHHYGRCIPATGRLVRLREGRLQPNTEKSLRKMCFRVQEAAQCHLSAIQWPKAYSQDKAAVATGTVSDSWVAQPKPRLKPHRTFVERPDDASSQTVNFPCETSFWFVIMWSTVRSL